MAERSYLKRVALCGAFLVSVFLSGRALAVPLAGGEVDDPEADAKARAQVIFERGVAAYSNGRFYEALELFLETSRIYPNPLLSFNIARAYEGLGSPSGALRYYRDYLRRAPNAADRADVEARVQKLQIELSKKGVQQLSILSKPEGALVVVDGNTVGITPWVGDIWAGRHEVEVWKRGYVPSKQLVELELQRARELELELEVDRTSERPRVPVLSPPPKAPERAIRVPTVIALAASALLLGGAVVHELATPDDGVSRGTAFLGGAGIGAAAIGGVLLYFDLSGR